MASNQVLHVNIPNALGFLEGILKPEEEGSRPQFSALVCHPHPLGGGTMHNKVVFKTTQHLQQNFNIPTLRFNFRGVGKSSGSYDDGRGEMDDVRFALDFLSRRYPGLPVILAGFSFGAYVGLRAGAGDDRVQAMIGLGIPAHLFGEDTLASCNKEKLFIHGTNDDIAPYDAARAWFEKVPPPKIWRAIDGADHFFVGRLDEVQSIVGQFVQSLF